MQPPQSPQPIKYDLPCPRCGYNLRGLIPDGLCPECGQAIALALRENLLRYADPDWVRVIRCGVSCEMGWLLLLPVMFLMGMISPWWFMFVGIANCVLFAAAGFFLTVTDASSTPKASFLALRILSVVGLVGSLGWIVAQTSFGASMPRAPCLIACLMFVPALIMKIDLNRKYAQRLISGDLVQLFALAIWMGGLSASIFLLLFLADYFVSGLAYLGICLLFVVVFATWLAYLFAVAGLNGSIGVELDAARMRN
jgi:hypothetical protein